MEDDIFPDQVDPINNLTWREWLQKYGWELKFNIGQHNFLLIHSHLPTVKIPDAELDTDDNRIIIGVFKKYITQELSTLYP